MAAPKPSLSTTQRLFLLLLLCFSPPLFLLFSATLGPAPPQHRRPPEWFDVVSAHFKGRPIRIGMVNLAADDESDVNRVAGELAELVPVRFDRVSDRVRWPDLFPEWIDEEGRWKPASCPDVPMPRDYGELDVVVARIPCGARDVFRLQVNLVVANLAARSGRRKGDVDRRVYAVFVGPCGPMVEIFRCDDVVMKREGEVWVYRPDLRRLKQKALMPVGSCQLAPPYTQPGKELWREYIIPKEEYIIPKEAYATILHSSQAYTCGAIALAQTLLRTNTTRDLLLLADTTISASALHGLAAAGWKIKPIQRIRNPHARPGAYNEWNYSKLRLWQLTEYDKLIFIDADLIVLKNMDFFFLYPQMSAAGNSESMFNSGIMVVEPSQCMFETLMEMTKTLSSYNGGDQGFLNEVFTWWHRWPTNVNHLKMFKGRKRIERSRLKDLYAIHYLGLKPWMCYRDYDCNWDRWNHRIFADDGAHRRWWDEVYEGMPRELQGYCKLTKDMEAKIRKWRGVARRRNFSDKHWKMEVKDPRQYTFG
ncbi:putative UDP-glucuronate:xylan alpha-glucuronosyltransferase 5 [Malania oleifera]|uniref:putative UDP-glucuronate:xylan alpha-glucuronosyltransferase 5 n=1 Tax=Malania oleifera TaxID=397392 RepID=UPI0025AE43B3|nr:putative UDP-glucuronate:xylan alpha-glucuronosyltransferase 5 [Malania oleifera]